RPSLWSRTFGRPDVTDHPMVWKEVHVEGGLNPRWTVRLIVLFLVGVSFLPAAFIVGRFASAVSGDAPGNRALEELSREMNVWVRVAGTLVGCLLLANTASRAASSIAEERERQTLDSLVTTPLEPDEILTGKLWGSILGQRWGWL